jgi:hypothetical protein
MQYSILLASALSPPEYSPKQLLFSLLSGLAKFPGNKNAASAAPGDHHQTATKAEPGQQVT